MSHPTRTKKRSKYSTEDRISALPDDVLQHVLGFLPADEAVHTSALARRWRYLWKSTRCLRIKYDGGETDDFINRFINCLLLLRHPSCTLDEVEIHFALFDGAENVDIWIRHALLCQAQLLSIYTNNGDLCYYLDGPPLVSGYLRRLELRHVDLRADYLDFSSCPALDDLKIINSCISSSRILSQSVKRLVIDGCAFEPAKNVQKQVISVPNLISLQFISTLGRTPLIESMLSLETAVIRLAGYEYYDCWDQVLEYDTCDQGYAGRTCAVCCGNGKHLDRCVLLEGLSSATNLELVAASRSQTFRRDLRWCPIFTKLKTLFLNDWCVQVNLHGLACMLEHSPVLENLTLAFVEHTKRIGTSEVEENSFLVKKSAAISGCLNCIKVKYKEFDDGVCKVLKFLSTLDMEIIIKRTNIWSIYEL